MGLQLSKTKNIITGVLISAVAVSASFGASASAATVSFSSARNCDSNAVMYCGAMTLTELTQKYSASSSVQDIYNYFGITPQAISTISIGATAGKVTKSGTVIVGGKTVANGARTVGRENIAGSTKVIYSGTTFYTRTPSVSFLSDSLDAFVVLNSNGQFEYAILASCGNAVSATNVVPAPAPAPKPAPAPAPKPAPAPAPKPVPEVPAPKPAPAPVPKPVPVVPAVAPVVTPQPAPVVVPAPAATPVSLPNTGPGAIIGIFTAVTIAGSFAYRTYLRRHLN